jgi:hypothetical protein
MKILCALEIGKDLELRRAKLVNPATMWSIIDSHDFAIFCYG